MQFFIKTFFVIAPRNETILTRSIPNNTGKYCFCSFPVLRKQEKSSTRTGSRSEEPPIPPDLPPKPKKPISFFFRFAISMRPTILRDNPTFNEKEIRKYAAELWNKSDAEAKLPYQKMFYTDLEKYYVDMEKYKSSLTEEQIAASKLLEMRKKEQRSRKKVEKKFNEFAKPKKPLNSFALYMASRKGDLKNLSPKDVINQLSEDWHKLPENEKKVFRRKRKELLAEYYKKIAEWKAHILNKSLTDENYNEAMEFKKKVNEENRSS